MKYGEKLKAIRRELQLSQKKFSEKLGISTMALSRLETNDSSLKVELLSKIESMGISLDWLIANKGHMFNGGSHSISEYTAPVLCGDRLREFRSYKNWSQEEFGKYLNLSKQAVYSLEKDKSKLKPETISRLTEMGANIEWILKGVGDMVLFETEPAFDRYDYENSTRFVRVEEKADSTDTEYNPISIIDSSIGHRLKQIIERMNMTQAEMGQVLNIPQSNLYRYESNASKLTTDKLESLYQLDVNINWLLTGNGEMFKNSKIVKSDNTINIMNSEIISVPYIDMSASAGHGIMNFEDLPTIKNMYVSMELLGIQDFETKNCFLMKAQGNSMSPKIESGDYLFVKMTQDTPKYLEGIYIVSYDGELYVKDLQLSRNKLVMRSINKDYEDIVIDNIDESDIYLQVIAKVLAVLKNV